MYYISIITNNNSFTYDAITGEINNHGDLSANEMVDGYEFALKDFDNACEQAKDELSDLVSVELVKVGIYDEESETDIEDETIKIFNN